jgi:hypothetical protein
MAENRVEGLASPPISHLHLDKRPLWLRSWTLQGPYLLRCHIPQSTKHVFCLSGVKLCWGRCLLLLVFVFCGATGVLVIPRNAAIVKLETSSRVVPVTQ